MTLGVYVGGTDPAVVEAVTLAIERTRELYVAPIAATADVVLAPPGGLGSVPETAAAVVLATTDPLIAAREAIHQGAHGIVVWPAEAADLASLLEAAASRRRVSAATGIVVEVLGARGGAGATTVAAYLAACVRGSIIVDARGGEAGQSLLVTGDAHASGARLVVPPFEADTLRAAAATVIVDGRAPGADVTLVVASADVGAIRAAATMPGHVVLNRVGRFGLRPSDATRALGRAPVAVIPFDARVARAADLGRLVRRSRAYAALRSLAAKIEKRESVLFALDPVEIA